MAINLPAHVDWAARRRFRLRSSRVLALGLGLGLVLGAGLASEILASASTAPEVSATATPPAQAAIPVAQTPTPAPTPPPTPEPTPPPPTPEPAPDFVARIRAPRLGIDHYIVQLGVADGRLQSPDADGVNSVAWYPEYGTPGRGGNSLFSAHETWNLQHGPFYAMRNAQPGDEISFQMTSGAEYRYVVVSNRRYPEATIPMGELIWPDIPPGEEWATFITCGGRFVQTSANGFGEYLDRDVVVAKRVG